MERNEGVICKYSIDAVMSRNIICEVSFFFIFGFESEVVMRYQRGVLGIRTKSRNFGLIR